MGTLGMGRLSARDGQVRRFPRSSSETNVAEGVVRIYGPGELPNNVRGGDFLLVRSSMWISRFIRLMTRSKWSHAAMCLNSRGDIAEALDEGVVRRHISEWAPVTVAHVSPALSRTNRLDVVDHAHWIVKQGWAYDWATFFGMALFWLSAGKLMISGGAKSAICSGYVSDCLHAGGVRFEEKIPYFMTPQDLAEMYGVDKEEE